MDDKVITRIFAVLAAQYGSRWTSLIQNEESETATRRVWADTLVGKDMAKIKAALDGLPKNYPNWPPTVGQFLELCSVGESDLQEFKSLPRPEGDPDIAAAAFAEMKRILGK